MARDLKQLAQAVGGTYVEAASAKFKFNAKFDGLLGYTPRSVIDSMEVKELKALYTYAKAKRDYGESIVASVPAQILVDLAGAVRNSAKKQH